jgi:hypothetical protein
MRSHSNVHLNICDRMSAIVSSSVAASTWSPCSKYYVDYWMTNRGTNQYNTTYRAACLENTPKVTWDETTARCGDGIVQDGEECDCGGQDCADVDPCCTQATCQLKSTAQCSELEPCCSSCRIISDVCIPSYSSLFLLRGTPTVLFGCNRIACVVKLSTVHVMSLKHVQVDQVNVLMINGKIQVDLVHGIQHSQVVNVIKEIASPMHVNVKIRQHQDYQEVNVQHMAMPMTLIVIICIVPNQHRVVITV